MCSRLMSDVVSWIALVFCDCSSFSPYIPPLDCEVCKLAARLHRITPLGRHSQALQYVVYLRIPMMITWLSHSWLLVKKD